MTFVLEPPAAPLPAGAAFLRHARFRLRDDYLVKITAAVTELTDEQIWWRPNEASNSIGNLILHLNGNVRQWLVASFRQLEDVRNRPQEFSERQMIPRAALVTIMRETVTQASKVLDSLTEADLQKTYHIQGYTVSGVHAVYQVVEHFAMHYGQIVYITKLIRAQDLGFYKSLDKTGRAG